MQKDNLYPLADQGPLQHLRWSSLWQSYNVNVTNSSILDIAGNPRPTLAEYFSMAASTLVPSAIFHLHMVLIMKTKSEQCIKAEIQAKIFKQCILKAILWDKAEIQATIFKQWILKTILWRHSYSIWFAKSYSERYSQIWSNGLEVKVLDSQSRGPLFKTTEWLQGRLSLSSFQGR